MEDTKPFRPIHLFGKISRIKSLYHFGSAGLSNLADTKTHLLSYNAWQDGLLNLGELILLGTLYITIKYKIEYCFITSNI